MSDPLIMQRKDGESDAEFAARVAEMLRQPVPEPRTAPDDERY